MMARTRRRQVAFLFDEAGDATGKLIGGKATSLAAMTTLNMPVPPGFVVTTGVCRAYLEHARYPRRLGWHMKRCLSALEKATGKQFGNPVNPLLVSVRSGASVSMPGMMDTVLNLGANERMLPALARRGGQSFAEDTLRRFRAGFKKVVGSESDDPEEQLALALEAVSQSWLNARATEYRRTYGIPDDLGTAIVVQAMVFGNLDEASGTGVFFSRNVATGDPEPYGEFMPEAQGEDVVGGGSTPFPLAAFAARHPAPFGQLAAYAAVLERRLNAVVEIEFTVESGTLWTLQCRAAKRTAEAAARFAVQFFWENRLTTHVEAVAQVSNEEASRLFRPSFDADAESAAQAFGGVGILARGLPASPGAAVGTLVFSSEEALALVRTGRGPVVLYRPETSPEDFAGMCAACAIVTETGGITSHAAVVARGLGKPAVVGTGGASPLQVLRGIRERRAVSVNGSSGIVMRGTVPFAANIGRRHKEVAIFLKWRKGVKPRPIARADFGKTAGRLSANTILADFYMTDALADSAKGTNLAEEASLLRERVHREAAEAFAAYLLIAVAGELRHAFEFGLRERMGGNLNMLLAKFGIVGFFEGSHRIDAQQAVIDRLAKESSATHAEFLALAVPVFNAFGEKSNVYGGPRWAAIAETVHAYLAGEMEGTVFVDRVFDLRHNGGRLFDKHPMFSRLTSELSLPQQLSAKREATSLEGLWQGVNHSFFGFAEVGRASPEVCALYERGRGILWGNPSPRNTRESARERRSS